MVRISVRIWKPSTSASVQMTTLFHRRLLRSKAAMSLTCLFWTSTPQPRTLMQVGDDLAFENPGVVRLQAVQDLAPDRHDALELRVPGQLARCPGRSRPPRYTAPACPRPWCGSPQTSAPGWRCPCVPESFFLMFSRVFSAVLPAALVHEHLLARSSPRQRGFQ